MDSCCFCRLLDDPIQYRIRLETEAVVSILEYCDHGDLVLVNSDALEFELQKIPDTGHRDQILAFLGAANIFIESNENIESRAENLCKLGFTFYDSLHLAFAEAAEVTIFLTTDDRLLRKARSSVNDVKIRVANPVNWLMENQELIQEV
ncbi:PIN domain-containing protein [Anabaena variabilis FACHB-164]|nr:PIN domain-containing protein [Trichormus variabilis FACHB-164]